MEPGGWKYEYFKILDKIKCNFRNTFISMYKTKDLRIEKLSMQAFFFKYILTYATYSLKILRNNQFEFVVFEIMITQKEPIIFFPFANLAWTKGQLISKRLFAILEFFKKRTKQFCWAKKNRIRSFIFWKNRRLEKNITSLSDL